MLPSAFWRKALILSLGFVVLQSNVLGLLARDAGTVFDVLCLPLTGRSDL